MYIEKPIHDNKRGETKCDVVLELKNANTTNTNYLDLNKKTGMPSTISCTLNKIDTQFQSTEEKTRRFLFLLLKSLYRLKHKYFITRRWKLG
jgi:hypothetical protein